MVTPSDVDMKDNKPQEPMAIDQQPESLSTLKPEKDYSKETDAAIAESQKYLKSDTLVKAVESLFPLEKQTRNHGDMLSTSRILVHIMKMCYEKQDWSYLQECLSALTKRRGQLKQAVTKMVQQVFTYIEKTPDQKTKLQLIESIRTITEGKIYVENERARVTKILSAIKESKGEIEEAANILQELQVETFGSMGKREKTEFLLDQMRLCLRKKDHIRTLLISRKINTKFFKEDEQSDLKLRFYQLMTQLALHDENYLEICKYHREIYETKCIQENEQKSLQTLQDMVIFIALAAYENEQSDLIHRIEQDGNLAKIPTYRDIIKSFTTPEILKWSIFLQLYKGELSKNSYFNESSKDKLWKSLQNRVVEHNIRIIAKYYTRITFVRFCELLDLPGKDAETFLSQLVTSKTIHARMDRPAGLITFVPKKDANEILNEFSDDISNLLGLIDQTTHLISKEIMVAGIPQSSS